MYLLNAKMKLFKIDIGDLTVMVWGYITGISKGHAMLISMYIWTLVNRFSRFLQIRLLHAYITCHFWRMHVRMKIVRHATLDV